MRNRIVWVFVFVAAMAAMPARAAEEVFLLINTIPGESVKAGHVNWIDVFALNVVTVLGLGLAIDYSLFMISRYREELERLGPGRAALWAALPPISRMVLFSSATIAIAIASLMAATWPATLAAGGVREIWNVRDAERRGRLNSTPACASSCRFPAPSRSRRWMLMPTTAL